MKLVITLVILLAISWLQAYTVITELNHELAEAKLALEVCQNCSATIEAIRHANQH